MGEQRKPDVDDVRKSSGSLHSGKQVRDPSDIRVAGVLLHRGRL